MPPAGRAANPLRVRVADRERLLHHHRHMPRRRGLDHARMIAVLVKRGDRLRMRAMSIAARLSNMTSSERVILLLVLAPQHDIRIEDADYSDVRAGLGSPEKT